MKKLILFLMLLIGALSIYAQNDTIRVSDLTTVSSVTPATDLMVITQPDSTRKGTINEMLGITGYTGTGDLVKSIAPTITGDMLVTGSATVGNGGPNVTKVDSIIDDGTSYSVYKGATQLAPDIPAGASEDLGDLTMLLTDVDMIATFGLGSGQIADIAVFNDGAIAGVFYNKSAFTFTVTSIMAVLGEGNGTETIDIQISWHATLFSGSAADLFASAETITSITTGDEITSFDDDQIPAGVFVWCTLSGASGGNEPALLSITMSGSKVRD